MITRYRSVLQVSRPGMSFLKGRRVGWLFTLVAVACLSGCGADPDPGETAAKSVGEMIRDCVRTSGGKLDAALEAGHVVTVSRDIVQILDDHEDSAEAAKFEEFHRGMEKLEAMAAKDSSKDELKAKIDELKELAKSLLAAEAP